MKDEELRKFEEKARDVGRQSLPVAWRDEIIDAALAEDETPAAAWSLRAGLAAMAQKCIKPLMWGSAATVGLVVIYFSVSNLNGANVWEAEVAMWKSAGGVPTVADLRPEAVPDEENFGAIPPMRLIFLLDDELGTANRERLETLRWHHGLKKAATHPPQMPSRSVTGKAKSFREWADAMELKVPEGTEENELVRAVLNHIEQTHGELLGELAKGIELPYSVPTGEFYDRMADVEFLALVPTPHIFSMLGAGRFLELRGVAAARLGEREIARDCVGIGMQLTKYSNKNFLVGGLVGIAIQRQWLAVIHEGLEEDIWTEDDLQWFDRKLGESDWQAVPRHAMDSELVGSLQAMEYAKRNPQEVFRSMVMMDSGGMPWWTVGGRFAPDGWISRNMAWIASAHRDMKKVEPGEQFLWRLRGVTRAHEEDLNRTRNKPSRFVAAILTPQWSKAIERFVMGEVGISQARLAIALHRHEKTHGALPDRLEQLVPAFIDAVPNDPVDGKPMRYERISKSGMKLWSIGVNEKDDGCTPRKRQGNLLHPEDDLVWGQLSRDSTPKKVR